MKRNVLVFAWSIDDVQFYSSLLNDANIQFLCGRLSSYLYAKLTQRNTIALHKRFYLPRILGRFSKNPKKDNSEYDCRFYNRQPKSYLIQLNLIRDILSNTLKDRHYDILLMPGEFRLREQVILKHFCKKLPIIFWEAGPVGSIYFSPLGTNANANLKTVYSDTTVPEHFSNFGVQTSGEYATRLKFVISTIKVIELFSLLIGKYIFGCDEYDEFLPKKSPSQSLEKSRERRVQSHPSGYIIFFGQVQTDVNFSHFSPDLIELRKTFIQWRQEYPDYVFVLKPHPREIHNTVNTLFAEIFDDSFELFNSSHVNLIDSRGDVHYVTVNSNVIAELLAKGRNVVVLGQSLYAGLPGVKYDLSEADTESHLIEDSIRSFLRKYFMPINYRKKQWVKYSSIACVLMEITNG